LIIASLFFYFCFIVFREKNGTITALLQKQAQKKPKYKQKQTNKEETKNAAPFEKADGKIVEKEAR
jgi:hypothetical protein